MLDNLLVSSGASIIPSLGPIDVGKARRTGQTVSPTEDTNGLTQAQFAPDITQAAGSRPDTATQATASAAAGNGAVSSTAADSSEQQVCFTIAT